MFKSDRCGIETWRRRRRMSTAAQSSSNQTVAGLKRGKHVVEQFEFEGSNQTVAGLKLKMLKTEIVALKTFKSDRCGIETRR